MAGLEPAMRESKSLALPLGYTPVSKRGKPEQKLRPSVSCGVGKGARTLDTRNHNPVLFQLSYTHHITDDFGCARGFGWHA